MRLKNRADISATSGGGVLFSSRCPYMHKKREICTLLFCQFWLFCHKFVHFLVYFYRPKKCGVVPKSINIRYAQKQHGTYIVGQITQACTPAVVSRSQVHPKLPESLTRSKVQNSGHKCTLQSTKRISCLSGFAIQYFTLDVSSSKTMNLLYEMC